VQLIELDGFRGHDDSLALQFVEVRGAATTSLREPRDGAGVHVADVRRGLERATVSQALDDADDGLLRDLGVLQEGPLAFAEAMAAGGAVQASDVLVLADPLGHAEVAGAEVVEVATVGVGTGQADQDGSGSSPWPCRWSGLASHDWPPCPEGPAETF